MEVSTRHPRAFSVPTPSPAVSRPAPRANDERGPRRGGNRVHAVRPGPHPYIPSHARPAAVHPSSVGLFGLAGLTGLARAIPAPLRAFRARNGSRNRTARRDIRRDSGATSAATSGARRARAPSPRAGQARATR
ncbi:hypothetical protein DA2_2880 [Desulfovibrio sp. A2]|nr:hypothetical protein DA2_2880 [Desulfovibrio sp. A2]